MKKYFLFLLGSLLVCTGCKPRAEASSPVEHVSFSRNDIHYYMKGGQEPFTVLFVSDVHFTVEDERGREFYEYSKRMGGDAAKPENYGKTNGRDSAFLSALEKAKKEKVDLVILAGDIVNFPSLASVEWIEGKLRESGLRWTYIAGNHDWHYEGEPGSRSGLRAKWTATNLSPLYQSENPMYHNHKIKGVNFVLIDNSTYEISGEQLAFFKEQEKKGLPIVLAMHIPLYLPGRPVDYGCGHPLWNEAGDNIYRIERRERWPKEGHTRTTYEFWNAVWNSPLVIGVFAGHTHSESVDVRNNIPQFVSGANFEGSDYLIRFLPAE